jgi:hypothetical protein
MAKLGSFSLFVSKVIDAPLRFVYAWCTDFREDDYKITGEKKKISILEKTKNRYIISVTDKTGRKPLNAAKVVTLKPPNSWHLDWIGDEDDEFADYRLSHLGKRNTRLSVTFKVKNKRPTAASRVQWTKHANDVWDKYAAALERDFYSKARGRARH